MIFCVRKFDGGLLKDHKTIKTRRMKNFNEQMFLMDVASINWVKALGQNDDINVLVSSGGSRHSPHSQWRMSNFRPSRKLLKVLLKSLVII